MGDTVVTMKVAIFTILAFLTTSALSLPKTANTLTCDICVDVITDIDEYLQSEQVEDNIMSYVKELCHFMGMLGGLELEQECNDMIGANIGSIIDGLINENLNPTEVCTDLGACP